MRPLQGQNSSLDLVYDAVTYTALNCFNINGRDARIDYPAGTIVVDPATGKMAAVVDRIFSANTAVYLSEPICFSGMSVIGRIRRQVRQISPSEISGSFADSTYDGRSLSASFDLDYASGNWISNTWSAASVGVAYIGNQFTVAKKVRGLLVVHSNNGEQAISTVYVQYFNGSAWTTHTTVTFTSGSALAMRYFDPPAVGYTTWRIMAGSHNGGFWQVKELNWFE